MKLWNLESPVFIVQDDWKDSVGFWESGLTWILKQIGFFASNFRFSNSQNAFKYLFEISELKSATNSPWVGT